MSDNTHSRLRCPSCSSRVKRVLRSDGDKRMQDAERMRRFRCRNGQCHWSGLLVVSSRTRRAKTAPRAAPAALRVARVMLAMLAAAGATWAVAMAWQFMDGP